MQDYRHRYRSCPLWIAVVLPLASVWFFLPAMGGGWESVWRLGPLMILFLYGVLVCFCNHVRIEVNASGAWVRKGPFPVGPQAPPVMRESIGQVYVRHDEFRVKGATKRFLMAGVRRYDGACLDLTEEHIPDETVRRQAAEIAAALRWQGPIVELKGEVSNLERPAQYANLCWAGVLMLSLVWVAVVGALRA